MMTYEDFIDANDVYVYKRVKRDTMRLGILARQIAAEAVGGVVLANGREYVRTHLGTYCLVMAHNSMNTTERWATEQDGVSGIIVMGDEQMLHDWFDAHGVPMRPSTFYAKVRKALRSGA